MSAEEFFLVPRVSFFHPLEIMTSGAWRIPLSDLDYGEEEERAVLEVVRSRWLTMGPKTAEFEARLAEYLGVRHVVAVSSCTAALEIAFTLVYHNAPPAHRFVAAPTLSFVATTNAIVAAGMSPLLVDSTSPTDPRMSLEQAYDVVRRGGLAALCTMHYAGFDAFAHELRELADRAGIYLVEDAAHALGGVSQKGKKLGTVGHIGCFSFFSNKNLAVGEGGALVTHDDELARMARLLRSHGLTSGTAERHFARTSAYDVVVLGHNMRWNELGAALGLVQLSKLDANNERRRELYRRYREKLASAEGIELLFGRDEQLARSAAHICVVVCKSSAIRDRLRASLHEAGIQTSHHYAPIHTFSAYRRARAEGKISVPPAPNAEDFAQRALTLPLYPGLSNEAVDEICDLICAFLDADGRAHG